MVNQFKLVLLYERIFLKTNPRQIHITEFEPMFTRGPLSKQMPKLVRPDRLSS